MTWALTKPLDPEDPNLPYNETDYRKRKPHPNFKQHIKCEREVSTIAKRTKLDDKLKTVVLGTGVTYGDEEGPLHYLFKMAWNNAEYLPIFGRGNNKIPLLDVRDLAKFVRKIFSNKFKNYFRLFFFNVVHIFHRVIAMLVETWPKSKYIVAAEQELVSQATIIKVKKLFPVCLGTEYNFFQNTLQYKKQKVFFFSNDCYSFYFLIKEDSFS